MESSALAEYNPASSGTEVAKPVVSIKRNMHRSENRSVN